ncbi:hypothetical protein FOS14_12875 [Skermania sp. ID1734]|uniref:hypothetical protein n=1 Tax=Skermania sp. ID1734 TaxID=2597516 RepID=UPI00117CC145|nr:hypothetical protein [Skermania sp. ID1734]TSD99246.1 hypothetical protein FOS14_12875 [Skermania sp. ID1734]
MRTFARAGIAGVAAISMIGLGAGFANAAPTVVGGSTAGSVTMSTDSAGGNWTCAVAGMAATGGLLLNIASTGQTVANLAPGSAVGAACVNVQSMGLQFTSGTAASATTTATTG